MREEQTFPASIGPWQFAANGVEGKLTLKDDGTGMLSGRIDEKQQVIGFWEADARKVTFLRIVDSTDPSSVQVFTGYLSGHVEDIDLEVFNLVGSYQAFSGQEVTPQRNVFGWGASMKRPA